MVSVSAERERERSVLHPLSSLKRERERERDYNALASQQV